jgi:predicted Rossmann fold flavoprotein
MLENECTDAGVEIRIQTQTERVAQMDDESFQLDTSLGRIKSHSLVIATGGLSIPKMGATDFGHRMARQFGLRTTPMKPALVPFTLHEASNKAQFGAISGVSVDALVESNGVEFRENILFTHRGLSGPAILQASSYWNTSESITLNTAPELDFEQMWEQHRTSPVIVKNILAQHLPKRFVDTFCEYYTPEAAFTPFSNLSRKHFDALHSALTAWQLTPSGTEGYAKAEVTVGGINTDDLSSKTMEAKAVRGLYAIGEVVDVTGWLGGYNFQWAWASGYAAGLVA